jgi:hypothetical protein
MSIMPDNVKHTSLWVTSPQPAIPRTGSLLMDGALKVEGGATFGRAIQIGPAPHGGQGVIAYNSLTQQYYLYTGPSTYSVIDPEGPLKPIDSYYAYDINAIDYNVTPFDANVDLNVSRNWKVTVNNATTDQQFSFHPIQYIQPQLIQ